MRDDAYIENLFRKIAVHDSREAFKELFFEFYPALCIFAQRYVNDPETSEDIVQETFLKIWKNRKTIDIRLSFRNFLLTSVRNSCTDYLRKESITTKYTTDQVELPSVSTFFPGPVIMPLKSPHLADSTSTMPSFFRCASLRSRKKAQKQYPFSCFSYQKHSFDNKLRMHFSHID